MIACALRNAQNGLVITRVQGAAARTVRTRSIAHAAGASQVVGRELRLVAVAVVAVPKPRRAASDEILKLLGRADLRPRQQLTEPARSERLEGEDPAHLLERPDERPALPRVRQAKVCGRSSGAAHRAGGWS
jgi:hypothetical protein